MMHLTEHHAAQFMALTLGHLTREFPHKLDHVMDGPADVRRPSELHPIFHGSFDFHSCVHGYWQVLHLARLFPHLPEAARVRAHADRMLTANDAVHLSKQLHQPGEYQLHVGCGGTEAVWATAYFSEFLSIAHADVVCDDTSGRRHGWCRLSSAG